MDAANDWSPVAPASAMACDGEMAWGFRGETMGAHRILEDPWGKSDIFGHRS